MTWWKWVIIAFLVALFVFAKVWVLKHPTGAVAVVVAAFLLIISESAPTGGEPYCLSKVNLGQ